MSDTFCYGTYDKLGNTASYVKTLINKKFKNNKNGLIYTVINVCWIGDNDTWGVVLTRGETGIYFIRSIDNFFGKNSEGKPRFNEVSGPWMGLTDIKVSYDGLY